MEFSELNDKLSFIFMQLKEMAALIFEDQGRFPPDKLLTEIDFFFINNFFYINRVTKMLFFFFFCFVRISY